MNPVGYRIEEKKQDSILYHNHHPSASPDGNNSNSNKSYRSTHSSRSSVLERAREYNKRIEQQNKYSSNYDYSNNNYNNNNYNNNNNHRRRSKSLERGLAAQADQISIRSGGSSSVPTPTEATTSRSTSSYYNSTNQRRSQSAGRPTRYDYNNNHMNSNLMYDNNYTSNNNNNNFDYMNNHNNNNNMYNQQHNNYTSGGGQSMTSSRMNNNKQSQQRPPQPDPDENNSIHRRNHKTTTSGNRSIHSNNVKHNNMNHNNNRVDHEEDQQEEEEQQQNGVVSPELLVDALSGHEDGLLAIAEKLMEHYDGGYDVMGEAIIDAFADVQKLFQHVVEAAHMEGAAFEASRREQEQQQTNTEHNNNNSIIKSPEHISTSPPTTPQNQPTRHDEFVDQDVKDVLTEAIRKGTILRSDNKDKECYLLYEKACQDASSLLPVDSDHRGRLQLSIARAESMSAERACAILRYSMDDVLRSGLKVTPLPDPSQRADVVLNYMNGLQSTDEALHSLTEELKEILSAPIYNDTPLQNVAQRFWKALSDTQKYQHKNEEKLEQNLAKLKGDYLLARAEWEEKLNHATSEAESYKTKYNALKERFNKGGNDNNYLDQARSSFVTATNSHDHDTNTVYGSVRTAASKAETVASGVSGLAQQARTIVMNSHFNCAGGMNNNDNNNINEEYELKDIDVQYDKSNSSSSNRPRSRSRSKNNNNNNNTSRSFRQYSKSPHRADI